MKKYIVKSRYIPTIRILDENKELFPDNAIFGAAAALNFINAVEAGLEEEMDALVYFVNAGSVALSLFNGATQYYEAMVNMERFYTDKLEPFSGRQSRSDCFERTVAPIVEKYFQESGKRPPTRFILAELDCLAKAKHNVIQEVDFEEEEVHWKRVHGRSKGREENMKFSTLGNRIGSIVKKNKQK